MTRHLRRIPRALALAVLVAIATTTACRSGPAPASTATTAASAIPRGGNLVVSIRTEPRSFNRLVARDTSTDLVSSLTQARLVRLNKVTQDVEPWVAQSWTRSNDGLRYTMKLQPDLVFSDGHPVTADDVVFSFQAVYDDKVGSALADTLQIAGKNLKVMAADPQTVVITFPTPFAAGILLLDSLPILPRHKLEPSLKAGTFANAWNLSTPPSDIVGLGPFVITGYAPGQRIVLDRNPHYFRKAADGAALPYLDRITIELIPDQNAEVLRLDGGEIDMMTSELTTDDYAPLKRAADQGRVKLFDLGVGYDADSFWINLKPGAFAGDPRAAWLQRDELRRAISMAVDRKRFADTVFLGAGVPVYGPETPANKQWYWVPPAVSYDPAGAKTVLGTIGLTDKNGDGLLEDARNQPARFTLITQKGRPYYERGAAVVRDELKKIGLTVDVVALDGGALVERLLSAKYDAIYFNPLRTALDPALNPDFWFSSGSAHVWNIAAKTPATDWERRVDDLMARQSASSDMAERKRLYEDVQKIFVEHLPMVSFVAPRIYAASSARVTNVTPAVSRPQLLWSADTVAVNQ